MLSTRIAPYLEHMKSNTQHAQCGIIRADAGFMLICWAGIVPSAEDRRLSGR